MPPPVPTPMPTQVYQHIDYSSFSQPSDSFQVFGSTDNNYQTMSGFHGYDPSEGMQQPIGVFPPSKPVGGHKAAFQMPEYKNKVSQDQFTSPSSLGIGLMTEEDNKDTSKFGFGYDSLVESIDELELTNPSNKADEKRFQAAKDYIDSGNEGEANAILEEMMEKKKLQYKQLSYFGNDIFMSPFTPISDVN